MKKIFNYSNIFAPGQLVDEEPSAEISKVIVPKIQRAYAQGRKQETYVRNNILTDIFDALVSGEEMDLNFIYGAVQKHDHRYVFELIDGQQRLTTLYLLYWYIGNRELEKDSPEYQALSANLKKFVYETRSTASDFCHFLSTFGGYGKSAESGDAGLPSAAIRNAKWYFKSFDKDSTIEGMLTMLDAIHEKYQACKVENPEILLYPNMDKIVFYVLSLGEFGLTEELYIKMNARGLPLSTFDNFKAELLGFLKSTAIGQELVELTDSLNEDKVPYYIDFSTKVDTKWINIFWSKENKAYDSDYFRFFYRYLGNKYVINRTDINIGDMRYDKTQKFFFTDSENQDKYLGFETYREVLERNPEFLKSMDKVLDVFTKHYFKDILPAVHAPWEADEKQFNGFFEKQLKQMPKILFCAITEFIEAYDKFDVELFKKWMRIAMNIVENTNIDNVSKVTQTNRNLSKLIHHAAEEAKSGVPFYKAIASFNEDDADDDIEAKDKSRSIHEEKLKAARIAEDPEWEAIFKEAEAHPFFKGSVIYFYSDDVTKEQFQHRFSLVKNMFDAKGVCGSYKDDGHILLRAMISRVKDWKEIWKKSLTDKVESQKHLKNLLSINVNIQNFLCSILDESDETAMMARLKEAINEHSEITINGEPTGPKFKRVHEAIYRKPRLQNWLQERGAIRLKDFKDNIFMLKNNSWSTKVMLDTEREKFIPEIVENYKYVYMDPDQNDMFESTGFYFGNEVALAKRVSSTEVHIVFGNYSTFTVSVKPSPALKNDFKDVFFADGTEPLVDENGFMRLGEGNYMKHNVYDEIVKTYIEKIEDVLNS